MSGMASKYYKTLPAEAQWQYKEKLVLMGGIEDPYLLWGKSNHSRSYEVDRYNWPEFSILTYIST